MTLRPNKIFALAIALLGSISDISYSQPNPPKPAPPKEAPVLLPPKLLSDPSVIYPANAKGDAEITLIITLRGDGSVLFVKADPDTEPFASTAIAAAKTWTFSPATLNGKPIESTVRFNVTFKEPQPLPAPPDEPPVQKPNAPIPPPNPNATPPKQAPTKVTQLPSSEVLIVGDKGEPGRSATLSRAEVREIPGAFGDPFRAIEILPGVTPIVSGLPFFYIRGAPPGNVGYFLDGVRVPLLYHIGVGPSVIHPGLIDRVDLYPGGYPARFGRFAGGIVSGETFGPRYDFHGEGNIRLFDAGAMVEAPFADNHGSLLLGGRYSYTAALLSLAAPTVSLDYWDYQGRLAYRFNANEQVTAFFFGSYDYLGSKENGVKTTLFGTEFHRLDLRYDRILPNSGSMRFAVMTGLDLSRISEGRYVRDRLVALRNETSFQLMPEITLRTGVDINLDYYDVDIAERDLEPSPLADIFPTRTDLAFGVRTDAVIKVLPRFEIIPGIRADLFSSQGATAASLDPRLAWRLALTPKLAFFAAYGIAHQPPAFAIPVPGFQPGGLKGGLQMATQQSAGLEWTLPQQTITSLTLYHNGFINMSDAFSSSPRQVRGCPPGSYDPDSLYADVGTAKPGSRNDCPRQTFEEGTLGPDGRDNARSARITSVFETRTQGTAYGLEFMIKRKLTQRIGGFFAYTLSRSTRSVGRETFIANFDRTHVVNLALSYLIGRNWRAGGRIMYYTGLPSAQDPSQANLGPSRLPAFYRIDMRLEKKWLLKHNISLAFVAEWMNVTLSKETVSTSCTLQGCTSQEIGPITVPSIGLEGSF